MSCTVEVLESFVLQNGTLTIGGDLEVGGELSLGGVRLTAAALSTLLANAAPVPPPSSPPPSPPSPPSPPPAYCAANDVAGFYNDAPSSYKYATIDGISYASTTAACQSGAYNLPTSWELAPPDSDGIRMATVGGWGTNLLVYSNGDAYRTSNFGNSWHPPGSLNSDDKLTTSTLNGADAYGCSQCDCRVLIRVSALNC